MKVEKCPKCGSTNLGDRWCPDRKLQQYCLNPLSIGDYDTDDRLCNWKGEPRIPERRRITNTKELLVYGCLGWDYIIYDKYGHEIIISETFNTRKKALKAMKESLKDCINIAVPHAAVLFNTPSHITVKGEMFKFPLDNGGK